MSERINLSNARNSLESYKEYRERMKANQQTLKIHHRGSLFFDPEIVKMREKPGVEHLVAVRVRGKSYTNDARQPIKIERADRKYQQKLWKSIREEMQ